ncbi:thiamine pyrophosphate-dependent enzyme, partial [Gemmatimonadota bacterium]
HTSVVRCLQEAMARTGSPHEMVLVTDIGCVGMADRLFTCHTVHGLHGRSPALGTGIAMSSPPHVKVVVLMGDGGAAIGLQHIMEAARLNVDMTLVVCDNQNYGMTGGQHSAYTCLGVTTPTTPDGAGQAPFRLCELVAPLGVRRARVLANERGLTDSLEAALAHRGFSLVETMNYCPSYSGKFNPETLKPNVMKAFFEEQGLTFGVFPAETAVAPFRFEPGPQPGKSELIARQLRHQVDGSVRILLAGSAGEGVQSAAEVFARAAMRAGLEVAIRGEYPVTVGKGFSAVFLLLSSEPILSPAGESQDVALVCSADGLRFTREHLSGIGRLVLDTSLDAPAPEAFLSGSKTDTTDARTPHPTVSILWHNAPEGADTSEVDVGAGVEPAAPPAESNEGQPEIEQVGFRDRGPKMAAFSALLWLLEQERWFPLDTLRESVESLPDSKARDGMRKALSEVEGLTA